MKLRVLSHTHWDREWFLPARYVRQWLPEFFHALGKRLRDDPDYRFVLDGQTILVEDAERALQDRLVGGLNGAAETHGVRENAPVDTDRLTGIASNPRVSVGPYYLQPDWNLVSPEALIRNIRFGIADAEPLGGTMHCGWLMDNFGQVSQCPQIHASFGMHTLFMWRGLTLPPDQVRSEYRWESLDGSTVTAVYLLDSYRNGMQLLGDPSPTVVRQRVLSIAERLAPFSPTGLGVVMNGYDQETEPEAINGVLTDLRREGIDIRQSTPDGYARELFDALNDSDTGAHTVLPVVRGEQYSGRYIGVFPGVLSARVYLKRQNWQVETEIERYTEPLCVSAHLLTGLPARSFASDLEQTWRRILRNQPHDSICGVSVDPVHRSMETRFRRIVRDEHRLNELALRSLAEPRSDPTESTAACVFNPLPRRRSAVVDTPDGVRYLEDVPPLGWREITVSRPDDQPDDHPRNPVRTGLNTIENGLVTVIAEPDGTLSLSGRGPGGDEVTFSDVLALEDGGDAGDTYNWSPPPEDVVLTEKEFGGKESVPAVISIESADVPFRASLIVRRWLTLPESLTEDRQSRSTHRCVVPIIHRVTLDADAPGIRITTAVRNTARDHRLRILVPLPWQGESHHYVGTPMDTVSRSMVPAAYDDANIPPELRRLMLGAREPDPITTLPMRDYIICTAATEEPAKACVPGIGIFTPGLFEYEYRPGAIAITLARAVGWLARPDLSTRSGDAGPFIAVPEAQCLRDLEFEMMLYPLTEAHQAERVPAYAEDARAPVRYFTGISCPDTPELLEVTSTDDLVRFSSMSGAFAPDDEHDPMEMNRATVLVRLYNPSEKDSRVSIRWHPSVDTGATGALVSLGDEIIRELERGSDGTWNLDVPAHAIRQCRFHLSRVPDRAVFLRPEDSTRHGEQFDFVSPGNEDAISWYTDHLATTPLPDTVTDSMIEAEERRLQALERDFALAEADLQDTGRKSEHRDSTPVTLQRVRTRYSTIWRTVLEARLSLNLLVHHGNEDRDALQRIGRELNAARISKRSDDYLIALKEETIHESEHRRD